MTGISSGRSTTPTRLRLIAILAILLVGLGAGGLDTHRLLEAEEASHDLLGHEVHPELVHDGCESRRVHVERFRPVPHLDCEACLHARHVRAAFGLEAPVAPVASTGRATGVPADEPPATRFPSDPRPRAPPLSRV